MKTHEHRNSFRRLAASLVAATLLATPVLAADATATTDDGLVPIKVKNVDKAYKRPGASLKGYTGILMQPVTVAFSKKWNPRDYGTYGLSSDDVSRIRTSLAKIANEAFTRVLTKGGYKVATAPGQDVLDVQVEIVDLYVNAPEVRSGAVTRSYVLSAGEMRMLITLRDSVTGSTLYRASDFKRDPETGRLEWANSVFNRAQADLALDGWARQLKAALDAAKAE